MKTFISPFNTAVLNLSLKNGILFGVAAVTATSTTFTVISNWQVIEGKIKEISTQVKDHVWNPLTNFIEKHANKLFEGYQKIWETTKNWSIVARDKSREYSKWLWANRGELWGKFKEGWGPISSEIHDFSTKPFEYLKMAYENSTQENIRKFIKTMVDSFLEIKKFISKHAWDLVKKAEEINGIFQEKPKGKEILPFFLKALSKHLDIALSLTKQEITDIRDKGIEDTETFKKNADDLFENPIIKDTVLTVSSNPSVVKLKPMASVVIKKISSEKADGSLESKTKNNASPEELEKLARKKAEFIRRIKEPKKSEINDQQPQQPQQPQQDQPARENNPNNGPDSKSENTTPEAPKEPVASTESSDKPEESKPKDSSDSAETKPKAPETVDDKSKSDTGSESTQEKTEQAEAKPKQPELSGSADEPASASSTVPNDKQESQQESQQGSVNDSQSQSNSDIDSQSQPSAEPNPQQEQEPDSSSQASSILESLFPFPKSRNYPSIEDIKKMFVLLELLKNLEDSQKKKESETEEDLWGIIKNFINEITECTDETCSETNIFEDFSKSLAESAGKSLGSIFSKDNVEGFYKGIKGWFKENDSQSS